MTKSRPKELTVPKLQLLPDGGLERLLTNAQTILQFFKNPYPIEVHIGECAFELGLVFNTEQSQSICDRVAHGVETSLSFAASCAILNQEIHWIPQWLRLWLQLEPHRPRRGFNYLIGQSATSELSSWLSLLPTLTNEVHSLLQSSKLTTVRECSLQFLRADAPEDLPRLKNMLRDPSVSVRLATRKIFETANLAEPWMTLLPHPPTNLSPELNELLNALFAQLPTDKYDCKVNFSDTLTALDALPDPVRVDVILHLLDDSTWFADETRRSTLLQRLVDAGELGAKRLCDQLLIWTSSPRNEYRRPNTLQKQLTDAPESWRLAFCHAIASTFSSWELLTHKGYRNSRDLGYIFQLLSELWPPTQPPGPLLDLIDRLPFGEKMESTNKTAVYHLSNGIKKIDPALVPWTRIEQQVLANPSHWQPYQIFKLAKKNAPSSTSNTLLAWAKQSTNVELQRAAIDYGPLNVSPSENPNALTQLQIELQNPLIRPGIFRSCFSRQYIAKMVRGLIKDNLLLLNFDECALVLSTIYAHHTEQCYSMRTIIYKLSGYARGTRMGRSAPDDEDSPKPPWWTFEPRPDSDPDHVIQPHEWALYRTLRAQVTDRNTHFWSRVLELIPTSHQDPSDIAYVEEARTLWLNKDPAIKTHDLIPVLLGLHGPKSLTPLLDQVWTHALTPDPDSDFDHNRDLIQLCLALAPNRFLPPHLKSHSRDSIPEWMDTSD